MSIELIGDALSIFHTSSSKSNPCILLYALECPWDITRVIFKMERFANIQICNVVATWICETPSVIALELHILHNGYESNIWRFLDTIFNVFQNDKRCNINELKITYNAFITSTPWCMQAYCSEHIRHFCVFNSGQDLKNYHAIHLLTAMEGLNNLISLRVLDVKIDHASIIEKNKGTLKHYACRSLIDIHYDKISQCTDLETLNLSQLGRTFNFFGSKELLGFKNLKEFSMESYTDMVISSDVQHVINVYTLLISHAANLKILKFVWNQHHLHIGVCIASIFNSLAQNNTLEVFTFTPTVVIDVDVLCNVFQTNTTLMKLDISCSNAYTKDESTRIIDSLASNSTLRRFSISDADMDITYEAAKLFIPNTTLTTISYIHPGIADIVQRNRVLYSSYFECLLENARNKIHLFDLSKKRLR